MCLSRANYSPPIPSFLISRGPGSVPLIPDLRRVPPSPPRDLRSLGPWLFLVTTSAFWTCSFLLKAFILPLTSVVMGKNLPGIRGYALPFILRQAHSDLHAHHVCTSS